MKNAKSETSLVELDLHVTAEENPDLERGAHDTAEATGWTSVKNAVRIACEMFTKRWMKAYNRKIKTNMRSGLTVALVNVCLSISLAISSNSTPSAGAVTAIFAGCFHALFAGSVGPTGALSGILAIYAIRYGVSALSYMAIVTGIVTFMFFVFRWERYVLLVPSSVTEGFTLGVAFILALGQLNFLLGLPKLPKHEEFYMNVIEQIKNIQHAQWHIFVMFLVSIVLLLTLNKRFNKVPWIIPLNVIGIALGYYANKNDWFELPTLQGRYGEVVMEVALPEWNSEMVSVDFISASVSVAFVAILETLVSAKIADGMTKTTFSQSKEVFALSLCNVAAGVFGGFPATAALARTALNIKSGATAAISEMINAVGLACICFFGISLFNHLPLFVISASIWFAAIRMVDVHRFKRFWRVDKRVFVLSMVVAFLCVLFDPTIGLAVGMIVSLLVFADAMSQGHSEIVMSQGGQNRMVSQREVVYNVNMAKLRKKFPYVDPNSSEFQRLAEMYGKSPLSPTMSRTSLVDGDGGNQRRSPTLTAVSPTPGSGVLPLNTTGRDKDNGVASPRDLPLVEQHGHVVVYRIAGQLTFINSCAHLERIKHFAEDPRLHTVVLALRFLFYVDLDGIEMFDECIDLLTARNKKVLISGVNVSIRPMVTRTKWYQDLRKDGRVFRTYIDALVNEENAEPAGSVNERRILSSLSLNTMVPHDDRIVVN